MSNRLALIENYSIIEMRENLQKWSDSTIGFDSQKHGWLIIGWAELAQTKNEMALQ